VRDLNELREEVFGSNESGLKYKFVWLAAKFESLEKKMNVNNWLTAIMACSMITGVIKVLFFI
jgi:hypothetical protein